MARKKLTLAKEAYVRVKRDGGHFIQAWRKHRKLSVPDLSSKVEELFGKDGVSASMIAQLEQGRAGYTQKTLEKLARALNIQPWQLLAGEPDENKGFWIMAFTKSSHRNYYSRLDDDKKPLFDEMIDIGFDNTANTLVRSAQLVFHHSHHDADHGAGA